MTDHDQQAPGGGRSSCTSLRSVVVTVLRPAELDSVQFQSARPSELSVGTDLPPRLASTGSPTRSGRSPGTGRSPRRATKRSASLLRLFGQYFRGTMATPM